MSSPRPAPELAVRRRRLLALHHRHAGLVRAVFYWLGADLEVIDGAVLRTFLLADRHGPAPDLDARPWLGRLAWRVASHPASPDDRDHHEPDPPPGPLAPRLTAEADLLARLLAAHAPDLHTRAGFVLAELTGLAPQELAVELACDLTPLRDRLGALRRILAADPEVLAIGGPRALLAASVAPFARDHAWQRRHADLLLARLPRARTPADLSGLLRRPQGIVGLGLAAVALLLVLRPAAPQPGPPPAPIAVAVPKPAPPVLAPPPPLPVPVDMSPEPAPVRKPVRRGGPRKPAADALAAREKLAQARDPGAIIVELEMLGAGRKSLAQNPRQALAYAEQHARDYPTSQLATQRAELRVRALCALGRRDEARSEANRNQAARIQTALREACP